MVFRRIYGGFLLAAAAAMVLGVSPVRAGSSKKLSVRILQFELMANFVSTGAGEHTFGFGAAHALQFRNLLPAFSLAFPLEAHLSREIGRGIYVLGKWGAEAQFPLGSSFYVSPGLGWGAAYLDGLTDRFFYVGGSIGALVGRARRGLSVDRVFIRISRLSTSKPTLKVVLGVGVNFQP